MAYDALTSGEVATGEPTTTSLFTKIKNNFSDHETRLSAAEGGLTSNPPIAFDVYGILAAPLAYDNFLVYRTPYAFTLTGVRLFIKKAGTSGTIEVEVEYKRGAGSWTSVLSGSLSAAYGTGDLYVVSGSLAVTAFQAADLFRINIVSVQDAMEDFSVYLENEVA